MGKVSLEINGRRYAMGCEDGEEERLMRLGQKLDDRVASMANQFGQIGDLRLLVMAGITLLDEIEEVSENVEARVDKRIGDLRRESEQAISAVEATQSEASRSLNKAAAQIEKLVATLSQADT